MGEILTPYPAETVETLSSVFQRRNEPNFAQKSLASVFMALPVLRGLWVSTVSGGTAPNAAGDWLDLSGLGKTLTYNGNPTVGHNDLAPYWIYDGVGDYHSRADEADLDILGTETYVAAAVQGLTIGGWFWFDNAAAATEFMIGKDDTANQRSYMLRRTAAGNANFAVSGNGAAVVQQNNTYITPDATGWYFCAGVYVPSTSVTTYVNGTSNSNLAGVPASIFNSTSQLTVAATSGGGGQFMTGRCGCAFLCAAAASDAMVNGAFQATRALFGV